MTRAADGQLPTDSRVVNGWVDGRELRSERSVLEENRKARQAENDRRAAEEAERGGRNGSSVGGMLRRVLNSAKRRF